MKKGKFIYVHMTLFYQTAALTTHWRFGGAGATGTFGAAGATGNVAKEYDNASKYDGTIRVGRAGF